jgi:hypothetical protein
MGNKFWIGVTLFCILLSVILGLILLNSFSTNNRISAQAFIIESNYQKSLSDYAKLMVNYHKLETMARIYFDRNQMLERFVKQLTNGSISKRFPFYFEERSNDEKSNK